jgi:hypothetical protein
MQTPRIERATANIRFRQMVENETDIRAGAHQFNDRWQLIMIDADIERQAVLCQHLNAMHE